MPFIPAAQCAQFEMVFQTGPYIFENVFHVQSNVDWTVASLDAVSAQLVAWWSAQLKPSVCSSVSLIKVIGLDLTTNSGPRSEYITGLPLAGTHANPQLPGNVTCAVKWTTGVAGRSFRGRTFHIGLTQDQLTNNAQSLVSTFQTTLNTAYNALITAVNATSGHKLSVLSKRHNNAWRVAGVVTSIIAASVEVNLDSQRRRLAGRGRA